MKAFVKISVPLLGLCLVGLFYSVAGNVVRTVEAPVQSRALSALDSALQSGATPGGPTGPDRYPLDQPAFDQFLQQAFPNEAAERMLDVWGTKLVYCRFTRGAYVIGSAGPDRSFGTNDDLYLRRSGETREIVHSLKQVAAAKATSAESLPDREGTTRTGEEDRGSRQSPQLGELDPGRQSTGHGERAPGGPITLKDALSRPGGDPQIRRIVQEIIEGQEAAPAAEASALPSALLALGPPRNVTLATASAGLKDKATARSEGSAGEAERAVEELGRLKDRVSAYVKVRERLGPIFGEPDRGAAAAAVEALAQSPENAPLKDDLLAMKDDFAAVQKLLNWFLREMTSLVGAERVFGAKRGRIAAVRSDSVVLQSSGKEVTIGIDEVQPEWIEEMSDLSRMAAEGTLYGLGVRYLHRGRADQAGDVFAKLGDWHEGAQRQLRWADLDREARANEILEEIRTCCGDRRYPKVKTLLASVRREYADSQLVLHARAQLQEWEQESEQGTAAMAQDIQVALARLDETHEKAQITLNDWVNQKKDEIGRRLDQELQAQMQQWSEEAQKGGKPISERAGKRVLQSIKQRARDRMAALQLRADGLKDAQRNAYLRLRRKIRSGEEVGDDLVNRKLEIIDGEMPFEDEMTAEEEAEFERQITGSSLLATRHYVIEHNCTKDEAQALGVRLDTFHDSLTEMLSRSDIFKEKLKQAEAARLVVRCLKDRETFNKYGKEHCSNFSEGWKAYYLYGTGGSREMVLYAQDKYGIAYHEAFHQFMHRAIPCIGEIPQWFNEGLATYYGTGEFKDQRFLLPEKMSPGRVSVAKNALRAGTFVPLEELLQVGLADWNGEKQALHYAEGYTLVHFLINYPDKRVASVFRDFVEALAETGEHRESLKKAFRNVKMATLEELWRDWISDAK